MIAGDLFDKSHPTLQEQDLVFQFFKELRYEDIQVTVVGGNHETIAYQKDTYSYLKCMVPDNVDLRAGVTNYKKYNTSLHFMSHCDLPRDLEGYVERVDEYIEDSGVDHHVLVTHFRTTVGEYVREEIKTDLLCKPFCLVIAGDIHTEHTKGNLVYTNQPINSAFASEACTSYLLLTLEESGLSYKRIPTKLPSLIQWNCDAEDWGRVLNEVTLHRIQNQDDMGGGNTDFLKINITGTLKELRGISSEIPNVKINKIPIVDTTVVNEVSYEKAVEAISTDMQLIEYLKTVPYTEDNINSLLEIWKEVV